MLCIDHVIPEHWVSTGFKKTIQERLTKTQFSNDNGEKRILRPKRETRWENWRDGKEQELRSKLFATIPPLPPKRWSWLFIRKAEVSIGIKSHPGQQYNKGKTNTIHDERLLSISTVLQNTGSIQCLWKICFKSYLIQTENCVTFSKLRVWMIQTIIITGWSKRFFFNIV